MDSPVKRKPRLRPWVEKRWPVSPVIRWSSVEQIPGGAKFTYVLGSATLVLFAVLAVTGVWQLLFYVPTVDHAYDSVMYLRLQVPFGWLVHGLHYWAAQAFIVVMGLHVARVFIWAAYKEPRELTWLLGVVLLLLGAAFIFTGAILPWDALGYWAGEVGTSIAGTVPLVGNFLKLLMRGGDTMGQMALSRAFVVHVAILPALTVLFIAAHLVAFRQFGSVGPWNPKKREKTGWFWPDQVFKDLLVVALIMMALICLSAFVRAPISGPADPLDNSYTPKPEWNFLFLYEALKAFKGSWEWMGTVVLPALLVLLLFAVPFIDRSEKRNPLHRPIAMFCGFVFVAVILVLTFIGHYSNPGASEATGGAHGSPQPDAVLAAATPGSNAPAPASATPAPTNQVAAPATPAPTPAKPAAAPSVSTNAPASATTAPASPNQVATSATSAPSPAKPEASQLHMTSPTADVQAGRRLFVSAGCVTCHAIAGKGGKVAPDLSQEAKLGRSSQWLITQITDPAKHNPSTTMPAHENLTAQQLEGLADYILNSAAGGGGATVPAPGLGKGSQPATDFAEWQTRLSPGDRKNPVPANATSLPAGKAIYQGECLPCHGPKGLGNGPASIASSERVSDLSAPTMSAYSDGMLFVKITQGKQSMPAFKSLLTETQRWEVVNYVRTLAPKPPGLKTQKPEATPSDSAHAPAPAATAPAPINQVVASAAPAASPAKPETASAVSANVPAPLATAAAPTDQAAKPVVSVTKPVQPEASQTNTTSSTANVQEGSGLFVSAGCVTCHAIAGKGGTGAPDLSQEAKLGRSSQWLITQITDPAKHNPSTTMPAHENLTAQQLTSLADFILNPSSTPAAPGAGTESNAEKPPAASATQPAQEKQNTTSTSPNSAQPAVGAEATPVTIVKMIGDPKHGAVLFDLDCAQCHGKDGEGNVPNPGSQTGVVSPLAPIARGLFGDDPLVFTKNIDRVIQHGASPPGPSPALVMPAFGDTRALTLPAIANIEAYILSLNGVDAAKIIHPGIAPSHFVAGTAALFALALLVVGGLWVHSRTSPLAQTGGHPTPEEFQTLKHEVADLKHKLEERETRDPKDRSESTDSQPGTKNKSQP